MLDWMSRPWKLWSTKGTPAAIPWKERPPTDVEVAVPGLLDKTVLLARAAAAATIAAVATAGAAVARGTPAAAVADQDGRFLSLGE